MNFPKAKNNLRYIFKILIIVTYFYTPSHTFAEQPKVLPPTFHLAPTLIPPIKPLAPPKNVEPTPSPESEKLPQQVEAPVITPTFKKTDAPEEKPIDTSKAINPTLVPVRYSESSIQNKSPTQSQQATSSKESDTTSSASQSVIQSLTSKLNVSEATLETPANPVTDKTPVETSSISKDSASEDSSNPKASASLIESKQKKVTSSISIPTKVLGPEVAIILDNKRFRPSNLRLHRGEEVKLLFTSTNRKPAALIIERLNIQKWLPEAPQSEEQDKTQMKEVNREISSNTITEIRFKPESGTYTFHDALTGAKGQIFVQ